MKRFLSMIVGVALSGLMAACSGGDEAQSESCAGADCASGSASAVDQVVGSETSVRQLGAYSGNSQISADFNANTGVFTLTLLGAQTQLQRFATADNGQMLAMRDGAGVHNAYFARGASGTQVTVYSGGLAGSVSQVAGFTRTDAGILPTQGTAEFRGDYAGFTPTRRINGDVQLDIDFAAARVEGWITNREFRQRPDNVIDVVNPLSDLRLESTALSGDGTFTGATGGGQIVNGQEIWNPATGSFAGLIGGSDFREAVGTLNVTHNAPSGASIEEIGGFFATR